MPSNNASAIDDQPATHRHEPDDERQAERGARSEKQNRVGEEVGEDVAVERTHRPACAASMCVSSKSRHADEHQEARQGTKPAEALRLDSCDSHAAAEFGEAEREEDHGARRADAVRRAVRVVHDVPRRRPTD